MTHPAILGASEAVDHEALAREAREDEARKETERAKDRIDRATLRMRLEPTTSPALGKFLRVEMAELEEGA